MENSIFAGFKIVKELRCTDKYGNEVIFSTQEREIDKDKKQVLHVNRIDTYYEVELAYQAKKEEIPELVFRICGEYEMVIDKFEAKMYAIHGNKEYAEFLMNNPVLQ